MPSDRTTRKHIGLTARQAELAGESQVDPDLLAQGMQLLREEKSMSHREALRHHWRALLWSLFLSIALVMDGYDGAIINSFYGLPAFKERFGSEINGTLAISANWQTALSNIGLPGNLLALAFVGWAQERFGSKRTYIFGMVLTTAIIFIFVFANSLGMLLAGEALSAFAWTLFNTLTAVYAVELCPIRIRGYAASFISMAWGMGSFIAAGIERAALVIPGDWGWRMPYTIQWFWPAILLTGAIFAPESPWWLVRHGRVDEAKKVLKRIASPGYYDHRSLDGYVAYIQHTDEIERAETQSGSFREMFKGTNLRRTEIMGGVWAMQVWSGTAMTAYAVEFFEAAGMSTTTAFDLNLVVTAMNLVGCMIEFVLISRFGRRPLLLAGMMTLGLSLLLIGVMGSVKATSGTQDAIGAFMVVINLVYHATVGPLSEVVSHAAHERGHFCIPLTPAYTIAAESPSSRLRAQSIAAGRAFYYINYVVTNQLTPRMISTTAWNWGAKASYFYFGANVLVTVWAYLRLPETRGFSFAELDILFSNEISARKFTEVIIHGNDQFGNGPVENYDEKKLDTEEQHIEDARVA